MRDKRVLSFEFDFEQSDEEDDPILILVCPYCDGGYGLALPLYFMETLGEIIEKAEKHLQEKHSHG